MTLRERILAVYRDECPDVVPCMLDLSHWFYHRYQQPWNLRVSYEKPEYGLVDYHRENKVGFHLLNLGSFFFGHIPGRSADKHQQGDGGRFAVDRVADRDTLGQHRAKAGIE
jgi:hypothetical protein